MFTICRSATRYVRRAMVPPLGLLVLVLWMGIGSAGVAADASDQAEEPDASLDPVVVVTSLDP